MKRILSFLMIILMSVTFVAGCNKDDDNCGDMTLEDLNAMLNDKIDMNMDSANTVAIIPFNHVNGPGAEWKFYALVNFQYRERTYVKYQVTYLSCTCRAANVNYWQTAYVELSLASKSENVKLQSLTFDKDSGGSSYQEGHYTAGFWGDSDPIPNDAMTTYQDIKNDFIPLLIGKTKTVIDSYNKMTDMKTQGVMDQETFDSFTGASVSTNNILRILHAMFKYHADTWYGEDGNILEPVK